MWMGLHWEWPRKGNIPADREAPHRRHGRLAVRFRINVGTGFQPVEHNAAFFQCHGPQVPRWMEPQ